MEVFDSVWRALLVLVLANRLQTEPLVFNKLEHHSTGLSNGVSLRQLPPRVSGGGGTSGNTTRPTFTINYTNNTLLKDGARFRYVSGSLHYFRVHHSLWQDRLQRARAMGLNVIQTYVEWSSHEPESTQYNFTGQNNLVKFLLEVQKQDMLVILRPGPYIDAERDLGGLPYWLLKDNPQIPLRTSDREYLYYVDRWFDRLLPIIQPLLYQNGGPIIMIQVENEYGSYHACDYKYTEHLAEQIRRHLGPDIVLFTTDGPSAQRLRCGKVPGVYATVDFGPEQNVRDAFLEQRIIEAKGPLINSEFYPGWLDHWGYPHQRRRSSMVTTSLSQQLKMGANVNIYLVHGGTSFGFRAGANLAQGQTYQPCPTSYDYDAPIGENGELREKYFDLRRIIQNYTGQAPHPPPQPTVTSYGTVELTQYSALFDMLASFVPVTSEAPLTFEQLGQNYGFIMYEHRVDFITSDPVLLEVSGLRDRAYVFANMQLQGILSRSEKIFRMPVQIAKGDKLQLLVENQGRVCFGNFLNDIKGITEPVFLGGRPLFGWNHTQLPMSQQQMEQLLNTVSRPLVVMTGEERVSVPGLFIGHFTAAPLGDTFLLLNGWWRGVAYVNGFNVGRYWPRQGPQVTLYVPGTLIAGENTLVLFELEQAGCSGSGSGGSSSRAACTVQLTNRHIIDGPTPYQ